MEASSKIGSYEENLRQLTKLREKVQNAIRVLNSSKTQMLSIKTNLSATSSEANRQQLIVALAEMKRIEDCLKRVTIRDW